MRTASVAFLVLVLAALCPAPAAAADNGEWSVRPADSAITPRAAFQFPVTPGTTLSDRAVVTNTTDGALTFRLYVADAHNTERDGGLAVRGIEETQRDVGAWGKPERDVITVPARSALTVGITLRIPSDASPGDHVGALVAVDERVRPGAGSHVGVQRGVGARIYLRIDGQRQPGVAVEDVRFTAQNPWMPWTGGSKSTVVYTLHNTGNETLAPVVSVRVGGVYVGGPAERQLTGVPSELLPGQKVRLSASWSGAPFAGRGDVTVTATADSLSGSASDRFLEVPWLLVGGLALVSASGLLMLRRRRKAVLTARSADRE
ncbi:LPXTG cell wall anchor domain-containing protein [Streptomyces sp. NPDC090054]|uniref:LPXTG cell wall anchor domain-containing protein n=1 Tax=Streptomyces sp. NPDC090054 TaxID=3365933 RepID=UPI0037F4556E